METETVQNEPAASVAWPESVPNEFGTDSGADAV